MNHEHPTDYVTPEEVQADDWFKQESLKLLKHRLAEATYPGYPPERLTIGSGATKLGLFGSWYLPKGPWHIPSENDKPEPAQSEKFRAQGLCLDTEDRPLHPWLNEMLADPTIGVVTGKGKYWNWGPNYTADSIIVRRDLDEPHILLVERADTGHWALPGGFVDEGEDVLQTAVRETMEETDLDISPLSKSAKQVFAGPLMDLRMTANAWPETTAIKFEVSEETAYGFMEMEWKGPDPHEAPRVKWMPVSQLSESLFGSHLLLIELALAEES